MTSMKLTAVILAATLTSVLCQCEYDSESLLRSTNMCMFEIQELAYSQTGCSLVSTIDSKMTSCLTVSVDCKNSITYTEYIKPKIDETKLLVESLRRKCASGSQGMTTGGRQGRNGCSYSDAQDCYQTFQSIRNIQTANLNDVFNVCNTVDQYVAEIQTCKNFAIACVNASDDNVRRLVPDIRRFVGYAEEMETKGCQCARRVYNCSQNVLGNNICEDIRRASTCALVVADVCVKDIVFIYVTVDWVSISVGYLRGSFFFIPFGCEVIAVGINIFSSAGSFIQISSLLMILMLSALWILKRYQHQ